MSAYSSAVLADNPVHYWRCADPGGGLGHDIGSSPIAIHGIGSPISQPFGYSGPISDGGSMDLSLVGVWANQGNPSLLQRNPISMECLYWNWQQLAQPTGIILKAGLDNLCTLFNNGTNWEFLYNGATVTATAGHTAQVWHHFVAVYDGANMHLYVDDTPYGPTAVGAAADTTSIFEIGTSDATGDFGDGFFAEIAVYHSALSAARVAVHFAAIDQIGTVPVFSSAAGSPSGGGTQLAAILAAVQKTFPTT